MFAYQKGLSDGQDLEKIVKNIKPSKQYTKEFPINSNLNLQLSQVNHKALASYTS